ncbi:type II toxin-antitoxin system PemK/MazF family toxin [Pleurocapsa sp. FMAR1]|uniref:type II toxin-antitoxin system PemK/MazF family toxin n=1 Tax=Pleurocapsa sp. FMAR1 TaxID=3040204 RepID=UPI0029C93D7A|nr:type II toxin-antitoxin system PemK/MazF family toxin [Pleurocapsa sp. FMAR1]
MVERIYTPKQKHFIWIDLDPQAGHEQRGRRPALVISQSLYNQKTGFAVICPISNTTRTNPFYVEIPSNLKVTGVILSEQFRSLDYIARNAAYIEECPVAIFNVVMAKIYPVLF